MWHSCHGFPLKLPSIFVICCFVESNTLLWSFLWLRIIGKINRTRNLTEHEIVGTSVFLDEGYCHSSVANLLKKLRSIIIRMVRRLTKLKTYEFWLSNNPIRKCSMVLILENEVTILLLYSQSSVNSGGILVNKKTSSKDTNWFLFESRAWQIVGQIVGSWANRSNQVLVENPRCISLQVYQLLNGIPCGRLIFCTLCSLINLSL